MAYIIAFEKINDLKECQVFNLGAEKLYKVLEMIRDLGPVTGQSKALEFTSRRLGFTESEYADW